MKLSAKLLDQLGGPPKGRGERLFAQAYAKSGVAESAETSRVFALPRRVWTKDEAEAVAVIWTELLKSPKGTLSLRPIQALALQEAVEQNGLFGIIGVGFGKTLISLLLGQVFRAKRPLLLVAPQLREQLLNHDIAFYRKHFDFEPPQVLAYSTLSVEKGAQELDRIKPDLVIADEGHNLRCKDSVRTRRFLRYFKEHPDTRFCALSGTMTNRSIREYAHLLELALRKNSPLPNAWPVLNDWADAIDGNEFNVMQPGVLVQLCEKDEPLRSGFRRRLVETPGVVATSENELGTSLIIQQEKVEVPTTVTDALKDLRKTWTRPDGEEFQEALELARVAKQLASGFYYRWVWPNGVVDTEWLQARAAWHREVREFLQRRAKPGLDSPLLLARAVQNGTVVLPAWEEWALVKHRLEPPVEAVWVDDYLCHNTRELASGEGPAIIWYEHDAVGERLAQLSGFPLLEGGDKASVDILRYAQNPQNVIMSLKAHGHGKNLQAWNKMIFTSCPSNGTVFEQALGRCHRPGQETDEVNAFIFLQTEEVEEAFKSALRDAEYVEQTTGQKQKLNYATKLVKILIENK